jgi:hypothetical protein
VWIAAHHDCAANNVDSGLQISQTRESVELVRKWFPQVRVSGLWVNEQFEAVALE